MMKMELKGGAELRRELLAMAKETASDLLAPIVYDAARDLQVAQITLAPKRTGAGAGSISIELIKAGKGYAYALVGPREDFYYMQFQEYGLGTGRSTPVSERVRRRRENYEASIQTRKRLAQMFLSGGADMTFEAGMEKLGLSKRERRRQRILAEGKYLQGERRPNMAAHPFARPAVTWRWPYIRQYITNRLRALIERHEKAA